MWTISKWPILMRPPRVIRKLMVSQMISLCQLITLLHVGSVCDYCLQGSAAAALLPTTTASSEAPDLPLLPALGFALSSVPGSRQSWCSVPRGQQQPEGCSRLSPLTSLLWLLHLSPKRLWWLLWLAHTGHLLHRALMLHEENKCLR